MARMAGSNPNYTFVLRNDNTGRYVPGVTVSLPSSTTIIKRTLAAPQLLGWTYRQTLDGIAALCTALVEHEKFDTLDGAGYQDIVDFLTDAAWTDEMLRENSMRPDDVRDARADEGSREHETLEKIASLAMKHEDAEHTLVQKLLDSDNGYERAIAAWWRDVQPTPLESETVLPCPQHGYCGSVDLVWYDESMTKAVTDLKTRGEGKTAYDSDEFQVDSYRVAYDLLHPDSPSSRGSVLVAREDGTYDEYPVLVPYGSFLQIKALHDTMQARKSAGRE